MLLEGDGRAIEKRERPGYVTTVFRDRGETLEVASDLDRTALAFRPGEAGLIPARSLIHQLQPEREVTPEMVEARHPPSR